MKYWLFFAIWFVLIVSLACTNNSTPDLLITPSTTPAFVYMTYTPPHSVFQDFATPTRPVQSFLTPPHPSLSSTPPPLVPEKLAGYHEVECSDIAPPEGYTSQFCYWIDPESNSFGAVYYKGPFIKAVATYVSIRASSDVVKKSAYFSSEVSDAAGWDSSDTIKCADALPTMHDGDSYRCGDLTVTAYISSDRSFYVIYFVED